jgi:hypothetical protein
VRVARRYHELLVQVAAGLPSLANVVNPTESQVIQALLGTAAEASIVTMQNKIEATNFNLGEQADKRDAAAGVHMCIPFYRCRYKVHVHVYSHFITLCMP